MEIKLPSEWTWLQYHSKMLLNSLPWENFVLTCRDTPSELLHICVNYYCWTDLPEAAISLSVSSLEKNHGVAAIVSQ